MSAKKNSSSQSDSKTSKQISQWFSGLLGTVILCLVLLGIFIACAYAAWQKIGPRVLASPEYFIGPRQIEITPSPPWLHHTDLTAEVYRDLTLHGPASIMNDDLIERVAAALLRQPWVAKVRTVAKQYPAKIKVDIDLSPAGLHGQIWGSAIACRCRSRAFAPGRFRPGRKVQVSAAGRRGPGADGRRGQTLGR